MEQNGEPGNKPSHIWSMDFQQECQDHSMGERIDFSTNGRMVEWLWDNG